jgi:hypothetical protein
MPAESKRNPIINVTARIDIHHAGLEDLKNFAPNKLSHLQQGGIREGALRNEAQTQQMLDKIPSSERAGIDAESAAETVRDYLADRDASHIKAHNNGGSGHPDNIKWEDRGVNRARGDRDMNLSEQIGLDAGAVVDNVAVAVRAGVRAAPKGAAVAAVIELPFAVLKNALRVVRGEISTEEAIAESVKETAEIGVVGGVAAFILVSIAAACPPISVALAALSPALKAAGGAGMIHRFFKILEEHKEKTRVYYENATQQELAELDRIERELDYEHNKNLAFLETEYQQHLEFLTESEALSDRIANRPIEKGIEGALKRYLESAAIAKSLAESPIGEKSSGISPSLLSDVNS